MGPTLRVERPTLQPNYGQAKMNSLTSVKGVVQINSPVRVLRNLFVCIYIIQH